MYKSKSFRQVKAEQGITRTGAGKTRVQARLQKQAAMNGRWNKGQLPKGASKKPNIKNSC